jgi:hypothetical protein
MGNDADRMDEHRGRIDRINRADRTFWMAFRQGLLQIVGAIERRPDIEISPLTSELRKEAKLALREERIDAERQAETEDD